MRSSWWLVVVALTAAGCTNLRVATPEEAAALDDLDWTVERPAAPAPSDAEVSEVNP